MNLKQHCIIDLLKEVLSATLKGEDRLYVYHLNLLVEMLKVAELKPGTSYDDIEDVPMSPVFKQDALYSFDDDDDLKLILVSEFKPEYTSALGYFDFIVSSFHYEKDGFKLKPYQACIFNDGYGTGIKVGGLKPNLDMSENSEDFLEFRHDIGLAICSMVSEDKL